MKAFGGELSAILAVLSVSAGLVVEFPLSALRFGAAKSADRVCPSVAFVSLGEEAEAAFLRTAKDTWRKDGGVGRIYADLISAELPEAAWTSVLPIETRGCPPKPPQVKVGLSPFLPSRRAADPIGIPVEEGQNPLAFAREELLKID